MKSLVPSLELCEKIPVGMFSNTALVYGLDYLYEETGEPQIVPRYVADVTRAIPAPTLAEILEALYSEADGRCERVVCTRDIPGWDVEFVYDVGEGEDLANHEDANAATAALKLWMEVNKGDDK